MPLAALAFMMLVVMLSASVRGVDANTIHVGGGIANNCTLVKAINAANNNSPAGDCAAASGADVIELHSDVVLFGVDNGEGDEGPNGLPAITTDITINGNGFTILRFPDWGCPGGAEFRIFHVTKTGTLTLNDVTVRNGCTPGGNHGGAILDHGSVTINRSTLTNNHASVNGGAVWVFSEDGPTPAILTVTNSTIADNSSVQDGGGLFFGTTASGAIVNSTFKGNSSTQSFGGAIYGSGDNVSITSSTMAGNTTPAGQGAGVAAITGTVTLLNVVLDNPDGNCYINAALGNLVSLGYNLVTDHSCSSTGTGDMAGLPSGLGPYIEYLRLQDGNGDGFFEVVGTPGSGHFPLLAGSLAINSANGVCPDADQLGHGRVGNCDRGAIESGVFNTQTLIAVKDSSLFADSVNTNEGINPRLHLRAAGKRRVVVGFDLATVDLDAVVRARLVLTIAANSNDWTGSNNFVDAHPLLTDFVEGNGAVTGVPAPNRGSGSGVTWKCAVDTNIANTVRNCGTVWNGGQFDPATAPGVVHSSGQLGDVTWDVTADVKDGQELWLIKKRKETALQPGGVRYYSREGSLNTFGNLSRAPRLILELR